LQLTGGEAFEPIFVASVAAGIIWVVSAAAHKLYDLKKYADLSKFESMSSKEIEALKNEACKLLTVQYDTLRYQHHAIQLLLEEMAGNETANSLLTVDVVYKQLPESVQEKTRGWEAWRELIQSIEMQMLVLLNTFGGGQLCKERLIMPDFKLVADRATKLKLPNSTFTASSLLIPIGWDDAKTEEEPESDEPSDTTTTAPQAQQKISKRSEMEEVITRLLEISEESAPAEAPRSGPLWTPAGERQWWCLRPGDHFVRFGFEGYPIQTVKLADIIDVGSIASTGARPCMRVSVVSTSSAAPSVDLCSESAARLREWTDSLNFHRCFIELEYVVRSPSCQWMESALQHAKKRKEWGDEAEGVVSAKHWMKIPWRRRALDASVVLSCTERDSRAGYCRIADVAPMPFRRSGYLLWRKVKKGYEFKFSFVLMLSESLSWHKNVGSMKVEGQVLIRDLIIDKVASLPSRPECFSVKAFYRSKGERTFEGCAESEDAANAWVKDLHVAYAKYFDLKLIRHRAQVGSNSETLRSAELYQCAGREWRIVEVALKRDRLTVSNTQKPSEGAEYLLSLVDTDSFQWDMPIADVQKQLRCPRKLPSSKNPQFDTYLPKFGKCFGFKLWPSDRSHSFLTLRFCGLLHLDKDPRSWKEMFAPQVELFQGDADDSPRSGDAGWGNWLWPTRWRAIVYERRSIGSCSCYLRPRNLGLRSCAPLVAHAQSIPVSHPCQTSPWSQTVLCSLSSGSAVARWPRYAASST
jgi:hypothetical protein